MNEITEDLCDGVSKSITTMLRSILLSEDIDLTRIVIFGEQVSVELRALFDAIIQSDAHNGPVCFHPWSNAPELSLTATTANELCAMLVRAIYLTIMPDKPLLLGLPGDVEKSIGTIREYIAGNRSDIQTRMEQVCRNLNPSEWSRIIAQAEVERVRLRKTTDVIPDVKELNISYSMAELRDFIGCDDNETVGKYLKAAVLPTASRGQSNFRLSYSDAVKFLRFVSQYPRGDSHKDSAIKVLESLKQPV